MKSRENFIKRKAFLPLYTLFSARARENFIKLSVDFKYRLISLIRSIDLIGGGTIRARNRRGSCGVLSG
ncbi:MAG TPA: hypothetical protein VLX12_04510, partial [Syntrophorhabdales bacterium]|nr:hypothetical protein [Syntrophorhabdales bacterium]